MRTNKLSGFFDIFSLYQASQNASQKRSVNEINLDCGRPVTFSFYDDLIGISQRYSHPEVPDPEVIFHRNLIRLHPSGWYIFLISTGRDNVFEEQGHQELEVL